LLSRKRSDLYIKLIYVRENFLINEEKRFLGTYY